MPFLRNILHQPRRLAARRVLFQIHLWSGILLSAYLVVIALSGAVLVFEDELTGTTLPRGLQRFDGQHHASLESVVANVQATWQGATVDNVVLPTTAIPAFQVRAADRAHHALLLVADTITGIPQVQPRTWVMVVHDLHVNLLLGNPLGIRVNGVGAAGLLLLAATGLLLWWPGLRTWTRGLRVSLRRNWRRVNFDLHNAIGFWTLLLVSWWAVSGIYFAWYREVAAVVAAVSPLRGMIAPQPASVPLLPSHAKPSLAAVLQAAQTASPSGHLYSVSGASLQAPDMYLLMDLRAAGDFSHRDIVRVRTADARVLSVWHYGQNHTVGDWILWAMHPLHFGTLWGLPCKLLWSALGLSLAVLTVTGVLMYWNRYLRKRWRALRRT